MFRYVDGAVKIGYQSPKSVFIPGKQLFCLDILLKCSVVALVAVNNIVCENGYMMFVDIRSTHHVDFRMPTRSYCDMAVDKDCVVNYEPLTRLDYCEIEGETKPTTNIERRPCQYLDHLTATIRTGQEALVATYVQTIDERASGECMPSSRNGYTCSKTFIAKEMQGFYVADIENFWVLLDHTVEAGILSSNAFQSPGYLKMSRTGVENFSAIPTCDAEDFQCYDEFYTDHVGDHIKVKSLLRAAHIDLDRNKNELGEPRRLSGLILKVHVEYFNAVPWNLLRRPFARSSDIWYTYTVTAVPTPRIEINHIRGDHDLDGALSEQRLQIRRRGLYCDIKVTGKLGQPSLSAFLAQAAKGIAGFAIANFIMGWMARCRPIVGEQRAERNTHGLVEVVRLPQEEADRGILYSEAARRDSRQNPTDRVLTQDSAYTEIQGAIEAPAVSLSSTIAFFNTES